MLRTLLCSLVVLALGTVLRSGSVLVHAHGDAGAHVHVGSVAEQVLAEHWMHAEHDHAADAPALSPAAPEDVPHDDGVRLGLSAPVALALLGCEARACPPPPSSALAAPVRVRDGALPCVPTGAGPPGAERSAKQRSGTAALLTTSRALLL